jgi:transposase-like protein
MTEESRGRLTRAFKLAALSRMLAGENVSALARELGIKRKLLYQWRARFRAEGPVGLRSRGRPKRDLSEPVEVLAVAPLEPALPKSDAAGSLAVAAPEASGSTAALAAARRRIADLERKVGQQELELDFFQRALRRVKDARSTNDAPAAPPSTRSSER